ncbi:hypothetical protein FJ656_18185, partial [Schumannella luteola]
MRARPVILVAALAGGLVTGLVAGAVRASVSPTDAAWEDGASAELGITAIADPPPEVGTVVIPDPDSVPATSFDALPVWSVTSPTQFCFDVDVRTESDDPAAWSVLIHSGMPPFNQPGPPFGTPVGTFYPGDLVVTQAADYADSGDLIVTPQRPDQWASSTTPFHLQFCALGVPTPAWQPEGPGTWEVVDVTLVRNGTQPCVIVTIRGYLPYYVGYTASFAWDEVLAAQATPAEQAQWIDYTHWDGTAPGNSVGATGATGADYRV